MEGSGPGGSGKVRAADLFVAELRPRRGGPVLHVLRIVGAFVSQLAWQLIPAPAVHDVVVARRRDGVELLRMPAENPLLPGELLAYVRGQLDDMEPAAFLAEWRLDPLPD